MYTINILDRQNKPFTKILNPQDLEFRLTLDAKDTASFRLPLSHVRANMQNLQPQNRIVIYRKSVAVWCGFIEAVRTTDEHHVQVGALGMLNLFEKRTISRSFTNWQGGEAVYEILDKINQESHTHISEGANDVEEVFSHAFAGMKVLKAWDKISEATTGEAQITPDFKLNFRKQIGADRSSEIIFRFTEKLQTASSIRSFDLTFDDKDFFNRITTYGKNRSITATAEDAESIAKFGLREKVQNLTKVEDQATLDAMTEDLLTTAKQVVVPEIQPDSSKIDFSQYNLGDRVRVIIKNPLLEFDKIHRILEISVSVGESGEEKINLRISADGTLPSSQQDKIKSLEERLSELESNP